MLSINQQKSPAAKVIPNLLPCKIHHDGPVGSAKSYWMPSSEDADSKKTAYFRGRQLHGKTVKVPEGYRGVVVEKKEPPEPATRAREEPEIIDVDAEDEDVPLGLLETKAEFEELVIWGHESIADASADPYVRCMDEWMSLSGKKKVNERGLLRRVIDIPALLLNAISELETKRAFEA